MKQIHQIKEAIKEIKKDAKTEDQEEEMQVKNLFKKMKSIKESVMTCSKFIGKGVTSDERRFGRKTLKKSFEESMDLPFSRFELFKK